MVTRYLLYTFAWIAAFAAFLFLAAGDVTWPRAWVFLIEYAVLSTAVVIWLIRHDPALLRERFAVRLHRDQAVWDRLFLIGIMTAFVAWTVLMALDARRFGWSHMPAWLTLVGAIAFAGSIYVTWLTFRANTFAVPQARIQKSRKQTVISDGPYAVVRHPMYAGALLYFVGMPLLLGSWWGLVGGLALTVAIAARSIGEERMLRRELDGYDAYAEKVRWRIMPGVW